MRYKDIPPYGLRLQPDLKEKLASIVQEKKRSRDWSLNSEIVERLEESLRARNDLAQFADGELIGELLRRYGPERIFIKIGNGELEEDSTP